MKNPFDVYGLLARSAHSSTVQAGRRNIQADSEKLVPADVTAKLGLLPRHSLLEVGCGPGALLYPLASRVARATGIDHADVLTFARERSTADNVTLIPGEFPDVELADTFDRILVYSVLHYMPDFASIELFIDAAIQYLKPCGRLLLGDLPNVDKQTRFRASQTGKEFEREWSERMKDELASGDPFEVFADSHMTGFTDERIMQLLFRYRRAGYDVYLLPQPPELPYGHTREDVLIQLP